MTVSLMFVFSGNFRFETGLLREGIRKAREGTNGVKFAEALLLSGRVFSTTCEFFCKWFLNKGLYLCSKKFCREFTSLHNT